MYAAVLCAQIKRLLASLESSAAEHEGQVASLMGEIKAISDKAAASQIEVRMHLIELVWLFCNMAIW
jgi:hypothetical protein